MGRPVECAVFRMVSYFATTNSFINPNQILICPRFYVNTFTKKSQWEKPTEPARPPMGDDAPPGPPPAYAGGSGPAPTDSKTNPFTPQSTGPGGASTSVASDAEFVFHISPPVLAFRFL